jgi:hypothetical protein
MENPTRFVRTAASMLAEQQKAMHDKPPPKPPAPVASTAVATVKAPDALAEYIDQIGDSLPGKLIKFDPKQALFVGIDDGEELPAGEYAALCDQLMVGWIRFHDDGSPPDKVMGLPSEGFRLPAPDDLEDNDPTTWPPGLDGRPQSPWRHQQLLPLQNTATQEVIVFSTLTETGRRSVGRLLTHYRRMLRSSPGELPVVRLAAGGFQHKDTRVGFVPVPEFRIVGRVKRDGTPVGDATTDDLDDGLPF